MADSVVTQVILNNNKKYIAKFTNASDGTGESAVQKIDISALTLDNGSAPTKVKIMRVRFAVSYAWSVGILFDHDTDDRALLLSGTDEWCYYDRGGLVDPASTGGTGDILFTTVGAGADDTYDIELEIEAA